MTCRVTVTDCPVESMVTVCVKDFGYWVGQEERGRLRGMPPREINETKGVLGVGRRSPSSTPGERAGSKKKIERVVATPTRFDLLC